MMTILNRLRGTYGWFASVFGVILTIIVYLLSGSWLVAGLIGVGYWFGEMLCGWGNHVGAVTVHRWSKFKYFPEDGENVGVRWLTSMITHPKLWRLHLSNAKIGIRNIVPKIMNVAINGYTLAKMFKKTYVVEPIQEFEISNALAYARVFLVVRGLAWWAVPAVGVALWVGVVPAVIAWLVLGLSWPVAAEIGYYVGEIKKKKLHLWILSYVGGWEWQEGVYGVVQDLVIVGVWLWTL